MKLDLPYYSQHRDIKNKYWQKRACGAVSLKMVLDFLKPSSISVNDFIEWAKDSNAYSDAGWIHQGLIDIAKDFGVKMEREEFKSDSLRKTEILLQIGIDKIIGNLKDNKPVLISAIKKWSEKEKFHMMVLVGFEVDGEKELTGFYYSDSDYRGEEGKDLFVDIKIFKKYWRKMAIFISG